MTEERATTVEHDAGVVPEQADAFAEHTGALELPRDSTGVAVDVPDANTVQSDPADSQTPGLVDDSGYEKPRRASAHSGSVAQSVAERADADAHTDSDELVVSYVPWKCVVYAFMIALCIFGFGFVMYRHYEMIYTRNIACMHSLIAYYRGSMKTVGANTTFAICAAFLELAIQSSFEATAAAAWILPFFVRPCRSLKSAAIAILALNAALVIILYTARVALIGLYNCGYFLYLVSSVIMALPIAAVLLPKTRFGQFLLPVRFQAPVAECAHADSV